VFVHCGYCDYDSGDAPNDVDAIEWLERKVKQDGGLWENGQNVCPQCGKGALIED
jgi:hypothetical protein